MSQSAAIPHSNEATSAPFHGLPIDPALMETVRSILRTADRGDLEERLQTSLDRISDTSVQVAVVGGVRQGKSELINSLLNLPACRVNGGTTVTTRVRHAETASATLVIADPSRPKPIEVPMPLADIGTDLSTSEYAEGNPVIRAEIGVSSPLLAEGMAITDTPGMGRSGQSHTPQVLNVLAASDAAVVVSDASREFTEPEVTFIRQVVGLCPAAVIALTKTDMYPDWRRILDADRRHLTSAGLSTRLIPVSSVLRAHALRLKDHDLNSESGFTELVAFLRNRALAEASVHRRMSFADELDSIAEHLSIGLASELAALRDPDVRERLIEQLRVKKTAAEARAKVAAQWQQVLNDGISDLNADIDHDLRNRMRLIVQAAETTIDENDPGRIWAELTEWLQDQVASAVGDNFLWAYDSSEALARDVAASFAAEDNEVDLPQLSGIGGTAIIDPSLEVGTLDTNKAGITEKLLVGMRGGFGGAMMFGMGATMLGLAMMNPITLGAGVLLGARAYKEDRTQRLARRRGEAKTAVRQYLDSVSFHVHKESRDRLRLTQRLLRDHFKGIAEQSIRSLKESVKAANESANLQVAEREERARALENQLTVMADLRHRATEIRSEGPER
ncbi:dynamin family protein [Rhodococcus sp. NPDC058521]|uniref:dynamin family protein n=1 Tax=Rhodococcus sp. NPDC058521 TaxID=3346536 RepID=UPI00364FFE07